MRSTDYLLWLVVIILVLCVLSYALQSLAMVHMLERLPAILEEWLQAW
jgi:hypothetical protein